MSAYEIYVFLLCLIVFIALTVVFTAMTVGIAKLTIRLIRHGAEDDKIRKEYKKAQCKKRAGKAETVFVAVLCALMFSFFGFSVYVNIVDNEIANSFSTFRVVKSDSMSEKNEKNSYLFENGLQDQIDTFDLILTHKLPDEYELELYDVVVYEVDGVLLVHRIVGIEEPNEKHPDGRQFLLQGDAVASPDRLPVSYSQMKAIYRGERIPFLGSFILFLQSPAGYLCVLLVLFFVIAMPIAEKRIEREKQKRLELLLRTPKPQVQTNRSKGNRTNAPIWSSPIVYYPVYYPTRQNSEGERKWENI